MSNPGLSGQDPMEEIVPEAEEPDVIGMARSHLRDLRDSNGDPFSVSRIIENIRRPVVSANALLQYTSCSGMV